MKAVLAIDPGNKSGLAVVTVEAAPHLQIIRIAGDIKYGRVPDVGKIIGDQTRMSNDTVEIVLAVIEDQYLGVNPDTLKKIARDSGRWEAGCITKKLPVRFIMPSVWQSAELGRTKGQRKREQLKKMAVQKCKGLWNVDLESDAADAALLGRYVALEMFYGRMVK